MKIKELVYMVLDEIKGMSDDFTYTEDHIIFLLNKYRSLLLNLKYKDGGESMHDSNFQTIEVELTDIFDGKDLKIYKQYMKSVTSLPKLLTNKGVRVYPSTNIFDTADIAFISEDRMRYVGYNKYLKNAIYATVHHDFLYVTSHILDLVEYNGLLIISAVFEDALETLHYIFGDNIDFLEEDFPLEESLVPNLIQAVVKELLGAAYRPKDSYNNANDDLSDMMAFIRRNMKSNFQKQLENDD